MSRPAASLDSKVSRPETSLDSKPRMSLVFLARMVPLVLCASFLAPRPAHAEPQVSDVDRQIAAASARLEALVEQHDAASSDLAATRARAAATIARIAELSSGIDAARERVGRIASWAYETGPTSEIGAVLASGSPEAFITRLTTIDNLAMADRRKIGELTQDLRSLTDDSASLRELEQQQARQETDLSALTAQVEKDIAALKALRDQIGAASRQSSSTSDQPAPPATTVPLTTPTAPVTNVPAAPPTGGTAGRAVAFAYAQEGKPYQWGADGPDSYDCSGLTEAAWHAAGVALPHSAARQYRAVAHISRNQLRPGDLVFYYRDIHHVAMYVGNDSVIHAPTTGDHVRVQPIDNAPIQGFGRPA
jgi:peptidoglycan DL-endopeptidase CwlO